MRHGFLLVDKPRGPSSHAAVATVRRALSERGIGHLGTLDPLASGLLVFGVGAKALKVIELFKDLGKEYLADVKLGATSTTYDAEGAITETKLKAGWKIPDDSSRIQTLLNDRFTGRVSQVPPQHSAISIGGQRAYKLAQRGETVEMPVRQVEIESCVVTKYAYPDLQLNVRCGAGTYIRSLAHDLGQSMSCGGYLAALRRTKVGEWDVKDAVAPDQAKWTDVLPLKDVLKGFPSLRLSAAEWEHVKNGRAIPGTVPAEPYIAWFEDLPVAIMERNPKAEATIKPRKVLA